MDNKFLLNKSFLKGVFQSGFITIFLLLYFSDSVKSLTLTVDKLESRYDYSLNLGSRTGNDIDIALAGSKFTTQVDLFQQSNNSFFIDGQEGVSFASDDGTISTTSNLAFYPTLNSQNAIVAHEGIFESFAEYEATISNPSITNPDSGTFDFEFTYPGYLEIRDPDSYISNDPSDTLKASWNVEIRLNNQLLWDNSVSLEEGGVITETSTTGISLGLISNVVNQNGYTFYSSGFLGPKTFSVSLGNFLPGESKTLTYHMSCSSRIPSVVSFESPFLPGTPETNGKDIQALCFLNDPFSIQSDGSPLNQQISIPEPNSNIGFLILGLMGIYSVLYQKVTRIFLNLLKL